MLTHRAREKYCTKCSAHHAIVRDYGLECVGKKRYWLSRSVIGRFDLNSISRRLIFYWTRNVRFLLWLMIVELAWFWISDGAKECRGWPWNWIGFERFLIPVFLIDDFGARWKAVLRTSYERQQTSRLSRTVSCCVRIKNYRSNAWDANFNSGWNTSNGMQ